ncbi:MAG: hypothetical protein GY765_40240, partial [bacterium]|nr:hypothetical protein [bacterium]
NKFKVYGYPTLVIYKNDGSELDRILGFRDTDTLTKILDDLEKGIGTLDDLLSKIKKYKKEDQAKEKFKMMSDVIDKYIARADFENALKMVDAIVALDKDNKLKQAAPAMATAGYAYYKWKKFPKAVDVLLSIHKKFPDCEEAEGAVASAAYYAGKGNDTALSLKVMKKYVTAFPKGKYIDRFKKEIAKLENK